MIIAGTLKIAGQTDRHISYELILVGSDGGEGSFREDKSLDL